MSVALVDAQPLDFAFNVCIRCKGRKKKCDKALPSCSRCTRLQVRCQYTSSETQGLSTPPESEKAGSDNSVAIHQDAAISFFPELVDPFSFISPHSGEHQILNIDQQLTEQCCDIMSRHGDDILVSCSTYFSIVHTWLPVIAKEEFYDRISRLRSFPNGEFSILVIAIHLTSQVYQQNPRDRNSLRQLYHTVKGFHSIIASTGRSSIELIQAGLLIAVYEHHQALNDTSYQTLGACARMGYALGFHKSLSQDTSMDPLSNSVAERQRQVWWGIIILERISMLEYIDKKLPFAIPTPLPTDLLPSDDGTRQPAFLGLSLHGATPVDPAVELSVHARIAQSVLLLSYVIDRVNAYDPNASSCGAAFLDSALRAYAMTLLQPNGLEHLCWPYSICLSALLTLNRFEVSVEPRPEEAHKKHIFQSRAVLGLQSVLRMILDGTWQSLNASEAEVITVPIWCFQRTHLAILSALELGIIDDEREKWTIYIQAVKRMLKKIEPRCKLAGDYLNSIEEKLTQSAHTSFPTS